MKKILAMIPVMLLVSCDQINKDEKYMLNCVKDYLEFKTPPRTENDAINECELLKTKMPEKFKYFKGFIFTQPSQL